MTFVCVIKKESWENKKRGKEKTVTLKVLSFASLLLPILFCCFHFALSSFLLCASLPSSNMLCLVMEKKTYLEVNTLSYNFITWLCFGLHSITVSGLPFSFFLLSLFESRPVMSHAYCVLGEYIFQDGLGQVEKRKENVFLIISVELMHILVYPSYHALKIIKGKSSQNTGRKLSQTYKCWAWGSQTSFISKCYLFH